MEYFDYNATAPMLRDARSSWLEAQDEYWHNPSSLFSDAVRVRVLLEEARERLAIMLNCEPELIVFTSSATESNNSLLAYISSISTSNQLCVISPFEHASVRNPAMHYFGDRLSVLKPQSENSSLLLEIESFLKTQKIAMLSVMAANNESGVICPWERIAELCKQYAVLYHCDATQWIGRYPLSGLGQCDFVTASAHKFGGPKGVGFIKITNQYSGYKSFLGGAQEHAHRAGTENYPSIVSMLTALKSCENARLQNKSLSAYRDQFIREIKRVIPHVRIVGEESERLWNTVMLIMPSYVNTRWIACLDKQGFAVSTGSACSANKHGESHVLQAMGYSADEASRAIRVSSGLFTTQQSWESLLSAFLNVWKYLESDRQTGKSSVISI